MKSAPAIGFRYQASRLLILATLVVAILALVAVWLGALPWWASLALTLAMAAYVGAALGSLLRPRVHSVLWRADDGADLVLGARIGGDRRDVQGAVHAARVMGPLIVLTLAWRPRGRATLWLLPDNLDADTRRRLRMRLGARPGGRLVSGNADSG